MKIIIIALSISLPFLAACVETQSLNKPVTESSQPAADRIKSLSVEDIRKRLNVYLYPLAENRDFSGTIRIEQNGKLVLTQRYGYADWENKIPHNDNTLYSAASVTKGVLAATLITLESQDKLLLTDKLHHYFPSLPDFSSLTIENVLQHKAGLPRDIATAQVADHYAGSVVKWLSANPQLIKVTDKKQYSNVGYAVLAELVQEVTELPFDKVAKELILSPLDMKDSFISLQEAADFPQGAKPYTAGPEPLGVMSPIPSGPEVGSTGLITTVSDLSRWIRAVGQGQFSKVFDYEDTLGSIHVAEHNGEKYIAAQGSLPGYAAETIYWPESGLSISYAGNLFSYPVLNMGATLKTLFDQDWDALPESTLTRKALTEQHLLMEGRYEHPDFGVIDIKHEAKRGGVFLSMPNMEKYWNFYLTPIADGAFHMRAFNIILTPKVGGGLMSKQIISRDKLRELDVEKI